MQRFLSRLEWAHDVFREGMSVSSIPGKLSREVFRKLRLVRTCCALLLCQTAPQGLLHQATDAEAKDDREIVCSEVFADVTGSLDDNAIGKRQRLPIGGRPSNMLDQY